MAKTTDFTNFATEHPNYFPGQYLLEEDFELQHKYLSDRQRYRNQSLHISGIIEGLEVEVTQGQEAVVIKPGSAIDSQGNLIILKENITFAGFNDITNGELYIKYQEEKQNQQQNDVDESYTRRVEKPVIEFAEKNPDNGVILVKVTISEDNITLDDNHREYSGISLPNSDSKTLTLRAGGNANPNLAVLTGSLKIDGDLTVEENQYIKGSLTVSGDISGNISATNINSGELAVERIPNLSANKINSGVLTVQRIPNLPADKITSGELAVERIPNLSANKINSGVLAVQRIPNLPADKITSGGVFAMQGNSNLRIIRGLIRPSGSPYSGEGFKSEKKGKGIYQITFDQEFSDYPAVIATQDYPASSTSTTGNTLDNAVVSYINPRYCIIKCGNSKGDASDRYFSFLCIGL
ncbi:hypothetical protein Riv7116_1691 [Rivularia sp. PCC 7116]|uniref:hypothetical protein n=1 Tax=Rivularia sp. PCC 7116 TaxID=373994 RepID=UPI00029F2AE9|nr:hypothetical protein [Rivularia sp. PCC 7116]AFY54239.1 hypothetical protein Riv7116_1691 [Rivularia sp. PCC 7116]